MDLTRLLPVSNPDCVHEWTQDPCRYAYECARCGYVVSRMELAAASGPDRPADVGAEPFEQERPQP